MAASAARVLWIVFLLAVGCRSREVTIEFDETGGYAFSPSERDAVREIAERTVPEVRRALPGLPRTIALRVGTSTAVMPETGETGSNWQPNGVDFRVDPHRPEGALGVVRAQLRAVMFHELHHVVRAAAIDDTRLRDHAMREGLATAFERDFAHAAAPWGAYSEDVAPREAREILALPDDTPRGPWLTLLPDGRRWLGMRVGTYWADCAKKHSGKTSADLVTTPTDAVLAMCPPP